MSTVHETRRAFTRLSFADGEVVVTPKDRSLFMISAEKAIEACRDAVPREEGIERFESDFLVPLHDWCVAHADSVRACYIPMPSVHIQVFIVTTTPRFNFDLAEKAAQMVLDLARAGWRVGVSQLPDVDPESLTVFFNPEGALEVYAQRGPASQEGGK